MSEPEKSIIQTRHTVLLDNPPTHCPTHSTTEFKNKVVMEPVKGAPIYYLAIFLSGLFVCTFGTWTAVFVTVSVSLYAWPYRWQVVTSTVSHESLGRLSPISACVADPAFALAHGH